MKKIMLALSIAMIVAVGAWFSRPYWQTKPQNQAFVVWQCGYSPNFIGF